MSLNNIQLNAALVAGLYEHTLIETASQKLPQREIIRSLGNNKKNILLVVSKDNVAFLEEGELTFLSNVLGACKLSLADIAIVNEKNIPAGTTYQQLIQHFNSRTILLFDVEAQAIDLPFNFPHFQLQQFDQCVYLSAPSLKRIEDEKALKTMLWGCLKNLFSL